jgi:DNA-binding HxlR family transcriptional regulator
MARSYDQFCPIARTLDIVGERWTLLLLRDMLVFGKTRFSDLRDANPGIPVRVLSGRLQKLMAHGLVERRVYSEHPLRAEYVPTEKGASLLPVLGALKDWGMEALMTARERAAAEAHLAAEGRP